MVFACAHLVSVSYHVIPWCAIECKAWIQAAGALSLTVIFAEPRTVSAGRPTPLGRAGRRRPSSKYCCAPRSVLPGDGNACEMDETVFEDEI